MKKTLALLLAFTLLLTAVPMGVVAESASPATEEVATEPKTELRYSRSLLAKRSNSDQLLYIYDRLVEGLSVNLNGEAIYFGSPQYQNTWDDVEEVIDCVLADYPEFFFFRSYGYGQQYFYPDYTWTGEQLRARKQAVADWVAQLTADLDGKSDYLKSLILHDRLVEVAEYEAVGDHQTVYGSLVEGTAVCAGYARGYQLLMQAVGIPTLYVTGIADNGQEIAGHAWNLALLDGNWYYTDVTWDDPIGLNGAHKVYTYFNVTYDQIRIDHIEDEALTALLPTADSTDCSYAVCKAVTMESFDVRELIDALRGHSVTHIYFPGDADEFLANLRECSGVIYAELQSSSIRCSHAGNVFEITLTQGHTCQFVTCNVPATCSTPAYTVDRCTNPYCTEEKNRVEISGPMGAHVYRGESDPLCDECAYRRDVFIGTTFMGNSVTEEVGGLAFLYQAKVVGATIKGQFEADYSGATMNGYPLLGMGAIVSNGYSKLDIPARNLLSVDSDGGAVTFGIRIVDIPGAHQSTSITAIPYYIVEIDGVATTVYGEAKTASYAGVRGDLS